MSLRRTLDTVFALFVRSTRVEETKRTTHLIRAGVCLTLFVSLLLSYEWLTQTDAPGADLLSLVMWVNFVAVLVCGVTLFTSVITEEKEQRTLGLMLMADVSPLAILLGKAGPRLLSVLLLLVLQVPFALLAITLGGVELAEVLYCYWRLVCFAVALASIALLASVVAQTGQKAASVVTGVIAIGFGVWAIAFLLIVMRVRPKGLQTFSAKVADLLYESTPFSMLFGIGQGGFQMPGQASTVFDWSYWFGLGFWLDLAIAVACFVVAWLGFERFAMRLPSEQTRRARRSRRKTPLAIEPTGPNETTAATVDAAATPGDTAASETRDSEAVWDSPHAWKEYRLIAKGGFGLATRTAVFYGLGVVIFAAGHLFGGNFNGAADNAEFLSGIFFTLAMALIPVELVITASRLFRYEIDESTWQSLMLLPETLGRLCWKKIGGGLINLIPSTSLLLAAAILRPDNAYELVLAVFDNPDSAMALFYVLAIFAFGLSATVLASLYTRAGAVPLALLATFGINMGDALVVGLMTRDDSAVLFLGIFANVLPAVLVVDLIAKRLMALAGGGG